MDWSVCQQQEGNVFENGGVVGSEQMIDACPQRQTTTTERSLKCEARALAPKSKSSGFNSSERKDAHRGVHSCLHPKEGALQHP